MSELLHPHDRALHALLPLPQFVHDCDDSDFLGIVKSEGRHYDLYIAGDADDRCLIARFGDDGPQYRSLSVIAGPTLPIYDPLSIAFYRAQERGLV